MSSPVAEICRVANLQAYEKEISSIVNDIESLGFGVAPRYDIHKSSIAWDFKIIQPSLKDNSRGHAVIWDLLHEYGHLFDGRPKNSSRDREINAWNFAKDELDKYPNLLEHIDDFESRRSTCLKSYGIE